MRYIYMILSVIGLLLTILPSVFVFLGMLPWEAHAWYMALGMVCWFVGAPQWMNRKKQEGEGDPSVTL